jgi:glycosyltransferase involved in cell wall biosynthesis
VASRQISEIEILIVDNASSDNTSEVVSNFQKTFNFVKYVRNDENIGPIANFLKAISLIETKYLHLLGDDDYLDEKYFEYIPKILNDQDYGVIFFNSYGFDRHPAFEKPTCIKPRITNLNRLDNLVLKCMQDVTFISAFILSTNLAKIKNHFEIYSEINFAEIVYFVGQGNLKNIYIEDYLVAAKRNNANIEIFPSLFLNDFIRILDNLDGKISAKNLMRFKSKYFLGYLPMYILRERIMFPHKSKDLLINIDNICHQHPFSRFILTKIVSIKPKYLIFYTYTVVFFGRIYQKGLIDTIARSFSFIKGKCRK